MKTASLLAALLAATAAAAKDGRTFAVLRFYGNGPLVEARMDPIISPGVTSAHVHTVMGGNAFSLTATGADMVKSTCSNALVVGDNSAYWYPKAFFHDKANNTFEPVELFYMNVYYFFEATNDDIKAFPTGLKMVSGDAQTRVCDNGGVLNQDPSKPPIQPAQVTCPRSNYNTPSYPVGSDGSKAGIVDPNNQGSGQGFPFAKCDGYASPMRMDLHFPSCYNPAAGLENYQTNMAFPTPTTDGKADCPAGWIHTPHIFYEVYWNTPKFDSLWDVDNESQPFVLANGDVTGCSHHGDFIAGWDEAILQNVIDTCDTGDGGMDTCAGVQVRDKSTTCNIKSPIDEDFSGSISALPGNNPLAGWGIGNVAAGSSASSASSASPATSATSAPASSATSAAQAISAAPTSSASYIAVAAYPSSSSPFPPPPVPSSSTAAPSAALSGSSTTPDISGWKYAGCYTDASERVITGITFAGLSSPTTNTACVNYCQSKGFSLAGTENGDQCFCGNTINSDETSKECNVACQGSQDDVCGGPWALSVYSQSGSVTPTVEKRSEHDSTRALKKRGSKHALHLQRHRSARRS